MADGRIAVNGHLQCERAPQYGLGRLIELLDDAISSLRLEVVMVDLIEFLASGESMKASLSIHHEVSLSHRNSLAHIDRIEKR